MSEGGNAWRLSIVVPVLDEAACVVGTLQSLQPLRARGHELIVVDGGSADGTPALAAAFADRVLAAPQGRAAQMNGGGAAAPRRAGIGTGDQAIFATRPAFARAGGFPEIALMEDIGFSKRMKKLSRPACLFAAATTSGRHWERHGVVRTILLMWRLRLAYFLGARPEELARRYAKQA